MRTEKIYYFFMGIKGAKCGRVFNFQCVSVSLLKIFNFLLAVFFQVSIELFSSRGVANAIAPSEFGCCWTN